MLLFNGERVQLPATYKDNGKLTMDLLKHKKDIFEKYDFPIVIKFKPFATTRHTNGITELPGAIKSLPRANVQSRDESGELIYCERYTKDEGGNIIPFPRKIVMDRTLIIGEKEWEKAVFVLFYSSLLKDHRIEVDNPREANKTAANLNTLRAKVLGSIFNPESYKLTDDIIRKVAMSYNSHDENIDMLKNNLYAEVERQQSIDNKSYQKFIDATEMGQIVLVKANIMLAVNKGLIRAFPENANTIAYVKGDEMGSGITQYNVEALKYEELADYLLEDEDQYNILLSVLGKEAQTETKEDNKD